MLIEWLHRTGRRLKQLLAGRQARRHSLVGPAKLWRMKRDFQIAFLQQVGLHPSHLLAEIGCGTLRGGIPIIRFLEPGHYTGIEVRPEALVEARQELAETNLLDQNPELILADSLNMLDLNKCFDFIWAFSVLFHMDDDALTDALIFISTHLSPSGAFYANVNIGEHSTGSWQGFPVIWRRLDFYRHAFNEAGLQLDDIGSLYDFGHRSGITEQDSQHILKGSHKAISMAPHQVGTPTATG